MKLGFFGGAFDPIHNVHKKIIISAQKELGLDKVIVYPSFSPPHKNCTAPYEVRRELTEIALSDLDYVIIDNIERDCFKGLVNPSSVILPMLKEKYGAEENYFIIGGDSVYNFHKWVNPEITAKVMKICAVARENIDNLNNYVLAVSEKYGADITILRYIGEDISGSLVKAKLYLGDDVKEVFPKVLQAIKEKGFYSEKKEIVDKVRKAVGERTFEHIKRTVYYALKLNIKLGLDFEKVFYATFLHDCAKQMHRDMIGVPRAVEHQFLGKEVAEKEYKIIDREVLNAIECHTTGKPNMTQLEKLVFCADMLEEGRNYPGVEKYREIIETDFEKGFRECVNGSLKKLIEDEKPFHPLTKACAEYYNTIKE